MNTLEIWKNIPGHEDYEVSNTGKCRNTKNKRELKNDRIKFSGDPKGYMIDRFIAELFLDQKPTHYLEHINSDKRDNRVENLRWRVPENEIKKAQTEVVKRARLDNKISQDEVWKDFPKYQNYEISNMGRCRNKETAYYLTSHELRFEGTYSQKFMLDHLVAELFLPSPPTEDFNNSRRFLVHLNGNKNDCRASNLRWFISKKENKALKKKAELNDPKYVNEEWKTIRCCPTHMVSNWARFRNKKTNTILYGHKRKDSGYMAINLNKKNYFVHRLVASAFIVNDDPIRKWTVNHINSVRDDNRSVNLEWASSAEQSAHKVEYMRNNGKGFRSRPERKHSIERLDRVTKDVLGEYETTMDACTWILLEDGDGNIVNADLMKLCRSFKKKLNTRIRRNIEYEDYGYIWRKKEETLEGELWKPILHQYLGGCNHYLVSTYGRIKHELGHLVVGSTLSGYKVFKINKKTYRFNRITAFMFVENPDNKPFVNHIDGNKLNNHYVNLEWVSNQENSQHAHNTGLNRTKRAIIQIDKNGQFIREFSSIKEAQETLGIAHVSDVCRGKMSHTKGYYFKYMK
jgi:hypothetical protein